jgi:hypothetical protein
MKIITLLSHPVSQVISFCIILVGSPYFGGPYGYFIYNALFQKYWFAEVGAVGILLTLASLLISAQFHSLAQLIGLLFMILSLSIFFLSSKGQNAYSFYQWLPVLTLLLFLIIAVLVIKNTLTSLARA